MYADIVALFKQSWQELTTSEQTVETFVHGLDSDVAKSSTGKPFPQLWLLPFDLNILNLATDTATGEVVVLIQDTPFTNDEERVQITNNADALARGLRDKLKANGALITQFIFTPFYKQETGILSGVRIRYSLTVKASSKC